MKAATATRKKEHANFDASDDELVEIIDPINGPRGMKVTKIGRRGIMVRASAVKSAKASKFTALGQPTLAQALRIFVLRRRDAFETNKYGQVATSTTHRCEDDGGRSC